MRTKTKMKIEMIFRFCFHFAFHFGFGFCFCFLKFFAFLLNPRGLEVPRSAKAFSFANSPRGQWCNKLSLDWPRSTIAPTNMAPRLIRISRIQRSFSLFSFSTRNILFGQIWSKKSKLSV